MIKELVAFFDKTGINVSEKNFSPTPKPELGDISCNIAFIIAKERKKNPALVAGEIVSELQPAVKKDILIDRVTAAGPYINIFYVSLIFIKKAL